MDSLWIFYKNSYKKKERLLIISILIFSIIISIYCQFPLLINKYAINDDVRQENYVFIKYVDRELFKNDYITDFYTKWSPWGLNIFYFIISKFYDPIKFTKFFPLFLCAILSIYMYKIGKLIGANNIIVGLLASFLFILTIWSPEEGIFIGIGGASNFGLILDILFIYYFLKKDLWKISITLVLQSLFYPPSLSICLLTFLFYILHNWIVYKKVEEKIITYFIGSSIIIFLFLLLKYKNGHLHLFGLSEIINMPEFYPGGRKPLFFPSLYKQLINPETGFAVLYPIKHLSFISLLLIIFLKKKIVRIPEEIWLFFLSSLIMFIVATMMIYRLYGPARYVRFTLPIFLVLFVSLNVEKLINQIKLKNIRLIVLLGFFIFNFFLFLPKLNSDYSIAPYPDLYKFLETLPKDVFIAGYPTSMDFVPIHARRKVLINEETSRPMYRDFYPAIKERTYDFFTAYYSDSSRVIYNFCKKYNITHIVIEKSHFSNDFLAQKKIYLNPFSDYIKKITKDKHEFALLRVPKADIVYAKGDVFVVEIKKSNFWLQ